LHLESILKKTLSPNDCRNYRKQIQEELINDVFTITKIAKDIGLEFNESNLKYISENKEFKWDVNRFKNYLEILEDEIIENGINVIRSKNLLDVNLEIKLSPHFD
jgi:hypothetical protein